MQVNDLVLAVDEKVPRGQWPLALVVHVTPGRDGLVRSCRVKSGSNEYVRPVQKLCLLEAAN